MTAKINALSGSVSNTAPQPTMTSRAVERLPTGLATNGDVSASHSAALQTIPHIRARMPRKGGNSFYRDKNNYAKFCVTLCGAPVTDKDVDYVTANTKKFRTSGWPTCAECLAKQDEMQTAARYDEIITLRMMLLDVLELKEYPESLPRIICRIEHVAKRFGAKGDCV